MGDQPIPGQDEDIFLGTNLYDFFFKSYYCSYSFCPITGTTLCSLVLFFFTIFFGSFTRNFRLPHCTSEFSVILLFFFFFSVRLAFIMLWLLNVIFYVSAASFTIDIFGSDPSFLLCLCPTCICNLILSSNPIVAVCHQQRTDD